MICHCPLCRGALPRLQWLQLQRNVIGSAGLIALAPGLRAVQQLKKLNLDHNGICNEGMDVLVASGEEVLMSREELHLKNNLITEASVSALVAIAQGVSMRAEKTATVSDGCRAAAAESVGMVGMAMAGVLGQHACPWSLQAGMWERLIQRGASHSTPALWWQRGGRARLLPVLGHPEPARLRSLAAECPGRDMHGCGERDATRHRARAHAQHGTFL